MQYAELYKYNSIKFNPQKLSSSYKAQVKTPKHTLKYLFSLSHINHKGSIQLKAFDYLIDDKTPEMVTDKLAYECGQVLYPLQLKLNKEGSIFNINNYEKIRQRWLSTKEKLYQYYRDPFSQNYINNQDAVYSSSGSLLNKLQDTPFFLSFFWGIYYQSFGDNLYREYIREIKGVEYNVYQSIETELDEKNCFSVVTEAEQTQRREKIYLRKWLNSEDNSIERIQALYTKNEETFLKLHIEKISIQKPVPAVKKTDAKETPKSRFNFWIDEKDV